MPPGGQRLGIDWGPGEGGGPPFQCIAPPPPSHSPPRPLCITVSVQFSKTSHTYTEDTLTNLVRPATWTRRQREIYCSFRAAVEDCARLHSGLALKDFAFLAGLLRDEAVQLRLHCRIHRLLDLLRTMPDLVYLKGDTAFVQPGRKMGRGPEWWMTVYPAKEWPAAPETRFADFKAVARATEPEAADAPAGVAEAAAVGEGEGEGGAGPSPAAAGQPPPAPAPGAAAQHAPVGTSRAPGAPGPGAGRTSDAGARRGEGGAVPGGGGGDGAAVPLESGAGPWVPEEAWHGGAPPLAGPTQEPAVWWAETDPWEEARRVKRAAAGGGATSAEVWDALGEWRMEARMEAPGGGRGAAPGMGPPRHSSGRALPCQCPCHRAAARALGPAAAVPVRAGPAPVAAGCIIA